MIYNMFTIQPIRNRSVKWLAYYSVHVAISLSASYSID